MPLQSKPVTEAHGICCRDARVAQDEFSLAHLALSVDAFETGRNWERRKLAGKVRPREYNLCNRAYRKGEGCSKTVSIWCG